MKKWKELNEEEKQARINKIKYWVLNGLQMASCVAFGYHLCKYVNARRLINFDKKYTMANMHIVDYDDGKYGFGISRFDPSTGKHCRGGHMLYENANDLKSNLNTVINYVNDLEAKKNG